MNAKPVETYANLAPVVLNKSQRGSPRRGHHNKGAGADTGISEDDTQRHDYTDRQRGKLFEENTTVPGHQISRTLVSRQKCHKNIGKHNGSSAFSREKQCLQRI